ncbi:Uncharacterised protein [Acinetobacter baumannii]|nr:Uncharacterised protein [Acinetobacter baumannii]
MWFQITSRPFCGIGNGLAVSKFSRPLPPSTSLVVVALRLAASCTAAGTVALRWVLYTGIL